MASRTNWILMIIMSVVVFYFMASKKTVKGFFRDFLPAAIGFVICLIIWLNLPLKTFIIGGAWMLVEIIYLAIRTKGFKKPIVMMDFVNV